MEDYLRLVKAAQEKADGKSIAEWEIKIWLESVKSERDRRGTKWSGVGKVQIETAIDPIHPNVNDISAVEPSEINKTRQYIERLITIHNDRRKTKGLEGLTKKQKILYDTIKAIAESNPNQRLTRKMITDIYEHNHGQLNILPTDFCYNLVNVGPDFETKFLISIERGIFEFVDFHWKAEGSPLIIKWTPKGNEVPQQLRGETFEVGKYYKGEYSWNFSELDDYL